MSNRFKDPTMRAQYDGSVTAFRTKHRDLFDGSGVRRTPGSSFASAFWQGYDGKVMGNGWDAASKATLAYAYWRAGQDCGARHNSQPTSRRSNKWHLMS
jgi:hypothetical protein